MGDFRQRYRMLFDNMDQGAFLQEADGAIVEVNPAALAVFGLTREEFLQAAPDARAWRAAQTEPASLPTWLHPSWQALKSGVPVRDARTDLHTPLRDRPVRLSVSALPIFRDGESAPYQVLVTLTDRCQPQPDAAELPGQRSPKDAAREITELKLSEERLKASEERFRSIMALSPDIIGILNEAGELTYNSPAALRIHGYAPEDLAGRDTFELIHPDDRPQVQTVFGELIAEPSRTVTVQYRYRNKDGSYTWMEASASNQLGNPVVRGIVCLSRCIADRKALEEERLDLERKLFHAQKLESLGVLAGGIAHDFNNLLAVILGNLDLALLRLPPEVPGREHIEQSMLAGRRAADLTRQMLAYSGKGVCQLKPVDLDAVVSTGDDLFRTVIPPNVTLKLTGTGKLPAIMGDPLQLQQVLLNLVSNAAEAIGNDTGAIGIATGSLECDQALIDRSAIDEKPAPGSFVYLEVTDTGCGMNEETKGRLFDPFFTTKFTGRGLGMAATQGIVKLHQGIILLKSEIGRGTGIQVLFPVAPATISRSGESARLVAATDDETSAPGSKGVALIVDDEELVRTLGATCLKLLGFEPLLAANGAEAVELFRQRVDEVALVILDLTMPVMDGVAAFRELKTIRPAVRVILSSGYSEQSIEHHFPEARPAAFIQKPFRFKDLRLVIAQVLQLPV